MPWQKGQSGNPQGCKAWRDKPIGVLARHHAPAIFNVLVKIAKDEKAPVSARVQAGQAVLDRAYGKPPTFNTNDTGTFKRAVDMTDDELAAIVAKARLTIVK